MDLNKVLNLSPEDVKKLRAEIEKVAQQTKPIRSEPEVKIIADSVSAIGSRLTTFELTFWRPLLPELNRHRALSQCVRSSRAVPTETLIKEILESPWGPGEWGKKQRGMVAEEVITNPQQLSTINYLWYNIAKASCDIASALCSADIHQQNVNRILEPFSCTHVVVSGTDWSNFFKLRCAPDAEPNFRKMALLMQSKLEENTPTEVGWDEWHMPYVSKEEKETLKPNVCRKISAARCARVSYKLYDGSTNIDQDLKLYDKLVANKHYSPLEHVATPVEIWDYHRSNFKNWNQLRKFREDG